MDNFKSSLMRLEKLQHFKKPLIEFYEQFVFSYGVLDLTTDDFDLNLVDLETDDEPTELALTAIKLIELLIEEENKLKKGLS